MKIEDQLTLEMDAKWEEPCCAGQSWYRIAESMKAACREKEQQRDEALEMAGRLANALVSTQHADGCYCEAAFAMPGQHMRHSDECEELMAALTHYESFAARVKK